MSVVWGLLLCVAGVAALGAAFVGINRHPEWNWRYGPARWLGTLGTALLLGGVINLLISQ